MGDSRRIVVIDDAGKIALTVCIKKLLWSNSKNLIQPLH